AEAGFVTMPGVIRRMSFQNLDPRPVLPADIPWLRERFQAEWDDVDFSWIRGLDINEWVIPGVNALMWRTEDGRRAAYTITPPGQRKINTVIADDPELARDVIATAKPEKLEHHPSGWLARNVLEPNWSTTEVKNSKAAMVCELQKGTLKPYLDAVEAGERLLGHCIWPLPILMC
ncbi:hypothetical protein ACFL1X_08320, partial [Candidatus Hydrogenedentota bacterium]